MNKMVLLMLIFSGIPGTGVFAARPFTIDDAGTVEKEGFEVEVALITGKILQMQE